MNNFLLLVEGLIVGVIGVILLPFAFLLDMHEDWCESYFDRVDNLPE